MNYCKLLNHHLDQLFTGYAVFSISSDSTWLINHFFANLIRMTQHRSRYNTSDAT
jgi:hypothetical protein